MGRRTWEEAWAYAGTEGWLFLVPGAGLCRKAPTSTTPVRGCCPRRHTQSPVAPQEGHGGANVRISNPKRSRGWGEPNTSVPQSSAEMAEEGGQFRRAGRDHLTLLVTLLLTDNIPDKGGREGLFWLLAYSLRRDTGPQRGKTPGREEGTGRTHCACSREAGSSYKASRPALGDFFQQGHTTP